jgi:hypothetical protein
MRSLTGTGYGEYAARILYFCSIGNQVRGGKSRARAVSQMRSATRPPSCARAITTFPLRRLLLPVSSKIGRLTSVWMRLPSKSIV